MFHLSTNPEDVVLSIGGKTVTGKDCLVESFTISESRPQEERFFAGGDPMFLPLAPGPTRISIELVCGPDGIITELFDEDYRPKIRNKKVGDCSIKELLFAVREKIKLKKK